MDLESRVNAVQERIANACARAGRSPSEVTLVAVTKSQPPEVVTEAARLGLTVFGENKIQEAKAKIPLCPGRVAWHFIGHLQSNKARDAARLFEMVQSIDSLSVGEELNRRAEEAAKTLPILVEVNVVGEASKFGYRPEKLLTELQQLNRLPRLEIRGLMTVPPWSAEPEKVRAVFVQLRQLKIECEQKLGASLEHLSMGMTGDFEIAIEEGATMVRLGTAIFGERRYAAKSKTNGMATEFEG